MKTVKITIVVSGNRFHYNISMEDFVKIQQLIGKINNREAVYALNQEATVTFIPQWLTFKHLPCKPDTAKSRMVQVNMNLVELIEVKE